MRQRINILAATLIALMMAGTSALPAVQSRGIGQVSPVYVSTGDTTQVIMQQIGPFSASTFQHSIDAVDGAAIHAALSTLENALHRGERHQAYAAASELVGHGVFQGEEIYTLIDQYCQRVQRLAASDGDRAGDAINLMSLVLGAGDGIFVYTLDVAATFLIALILLPIPFGIILAMFYMYLWLVVSHAVPFRLVQPTTSFWLFNGSFNTLGLKGSQTLEASEDRPANGSMLGFAGVIVNLIIPRKDNNSIYYYFCLGSAVAVLPTILPVLAFFTSPAGKHKPTTTQTFNILAA